MIMSIFLLRTGEKVQRQGESYKTVSINLKKSMIADLVDIEKEVHPEWTV